MVVLLTLFIRLKDDNEWREYMAEGRRISCQNVKELCVKLYMVRGIPKDDAEIVVDNLIEAELNGIYSHGVTRMKMYMRYIDNGKINHNGEIKILNESTATLHVDGNNCLGAVAATKAVRRGINKAKEVGAAVVSVRRSNHFGTAAYYTQMIAQEGMVGIAATNAFPHVAPLGSSKAYLGTNPISFGVPTPSGKPMVLDMATSVVARGKISVAAEKGESIPLGWALDAEGKPTTDAKEAVKGVLLPIAGPKGYGLSLFVDILSGVLSGAKFGGNLAPAKEGKTTNNDNTSNVNDIGHFFLIVDISRFMPLTLFNERIGTMINEIKALPKVEGVSEIYMPGEIESNKAEENEEDGLLLDESILSDLEKMCERFGLQYDL